jgi:hypothetical protein
MRQRNPGRRLFPIGAALLAASWRGGSVLGACGPFADVAADSFCPFVLQIFYLGITTGRRRRPTIPRPTSRLQMAAFPRTVDGALRRGAGERA